MEVQPSVETVRNNKKATRSVNELHNEALLLFNGHAIGAIAQEEPALFMKRSAMLTAYRYEKAAKAHILGEGGHLSRKLVREIRRVSGERKCRTVRHVGSPWETVPQTGEHSRIYSVGFPTYWKPPCRY